MAAAVAFSLATPVAQAEENGRQLLYFNHAYGVLDRTTADAIEHSKYLRDFAAFEVRTSTGEQGSWTGRYLYGRETYLEFFGVGDLPAPDGELGSGGLALSTENDGELAQVKARLPRFGAPEPFEFEQKRNWNDGTPPVPWFDALFDDMRYDRFGPWAMEYREEYFADPRAKKDEPPSHPGDVSRERYLPDDYEKHLMRDVTSVWFGVTQADQDDTVKLLKAGGFAVHKIGTSVVATRGGTTMRFDAVPLAQVGLKEVTFGLNRPANRHVERIGNSTLTVGPGSRAVWKF